jgi:signal transduction histidine kinase
VQAIARGHGGEVYVQSVLGQGSRFELLLPSAAEPDWDQPALDQETW